MATLRNNCIQSTNPITFELSGVCTSIEELNDIIQFNKETGISNTHLIEDLYGQLLDLNNLINFLTKKNASYNLCISPSSNQVVALKPVVNLTKPSTLRKIQKVIECKPVLINKSQMIWRNQIVSISKNEVPILGVGNFNKVGDRLISNSGKDLIDYLPVHFGKDVGDLVYMGIVDYKWIGNKATIFEEFVLEYQVYDKKTTVTKVFPASIFLWKTIADNKLSFIN